MPELPTTTRGAATSRRILDAATEEFAARGIAGARIERITAAANTNKAQLYGYFGNKEGLFDAVLADCLERSANAVAFDVDDLAGWAVAMYDENLRHPALVRLMGWIRLEQRPAGLLFTNLALEPKLRAVAQAQAAGRIRPGDPADLLALVVAMASAWSPTSGAYAATADEPAADHDRRRALLRESVQRAVAP
ncbi:MAG: TetR/AcrR family transcriptional regulator [Hamadaea sp.]|uniref:TetR/AcrR family transcriptional regulator n=1 Tax=Hamadaea sp. TaxID=2024425 RepID=UPI0017EE31F7|nr:TetR family transcriptional regulator [Hamadaea sp.]NUR72826.1 TetR/AcrR family transcriptional regulator [Hamadaea sp.]NUT20459.1 TetR/AcrR family transcriptional regulator [Hamadaea sp.]